MKKILIIDIETTGFSHSKNHIVEVGIVELDLDTGKRKIIFDEIVRERSITKDEITKSWIVENSDLTFEMIIYGSRDFDELKSIIQNIISKYSLGATAYNNAFDFGFLESRDINIPVKLDCPMLLLAKHVQYITGKYKRPTVEEAYSFFFPDVEYIEKHRGAGDAMHEAEIVFELYKLGIFTL